MAQSRPNRGIVGANYQRQRFVMKPWDAEGGVLSTHINYVYGYFYVIYGEGGGEVRLCYSYTIYEYSPFEITRQAL